MVEIAVQIGGYLSAGRLQYAIFVEPDIPAIGPALRDRCGDRSVPCRAGNKSDLASNVPAWRVGGAPVDVHEPPIIILGFNESCS